jgi:nucleotide-binding universal stress UspA family protein
MALPYRRILFPTDLSDASFAAWPHATALAEKLGAEIVAVTVIEEPYALAPFGHYALLLDALREVRPQVERQLVERTKDHPKPVRVRHVVLEGLSPAKVLLDEAKRGESDVIVMATHGRGGLSHFLLGSVAEKLARLAPMPVLLVRAPPEK